jgi:hypothetical protein
MYPLLLLLQAEQAGAGEGALLQASVHFRLHNMSSGKPSSVQQQLATPACCYHASIVAGRTLQLPH